MIDLGLTKLGKLLQFEDNYVQLLGKTPAVENEGIPKNPGEAINESSGTIYAFSLEGHGAF